MYSILFDFVFILKCHITYITCLLGRLYQYISPSVTRKPWRVMSPSAFGIGYVILEAMWYMYIIDCLFKQNTHERSTHSSAISLITLPIFLPKIAKNLGYFRKLVGRSLAYKFYFWLIIGSILHWNMYLHFATYLNS